MLPTERALKFIQFGHAFDVRTILFCSFCRLKAAEESFRQAKEKSAYSVKPKHASGIVSCSLTLDFETKHSNPRPMGHSLEKDYRSIMISAELI